jgi:IS1 family transposase
LISPERSRIMVSMNRLSTKRRAQVIGCLVEGMSIRGTVRVTGVAKNTVTKLLVDLGEACSIYQDGTLRGLRSETIECDEIWSFVGAKAKNVTEEHPEEFGDMWTWVAIDADTKLVASWLVGPRTIEAGAEFLTDLAKRLRGRVQLTSDAWRAYARAVPQAFGHDVDFAQIHKTYGKDPNLTYGAERTYSPERCTGVDVKIQIGDPDPEKISTSYVERQNLTMRMGMRRFTRLTNAFSKKLENHMCAISLHFLYYNFARPHITLTKRAGTPTTPAMASGVADHIWNLNEIAGLLDPGNTVSGIAQAEASN